MKILITGKNSFIGSSFIRYSRFTDIEEVSLRDTNPEEIDFKKYDVVLHLAAIVHQTDNIATDLYFSVNRDLCVRTAVCAKKSGVRHFVFLSTLKVYGEIEDDKIVRDENSPCQPSDAYGKSKYEAENELRKLENPDFIVSIIRSSVVYGDGVKANILNLIKLVDKIRILPFGNINNHRNFVYIENLITYIDTIIKQRISGIFIAIDRKSMSTTTLIRLISKNLEKKTLLIGLPRFAVKIGRVIMPATFTRLYSSLEFDNTMTIKKLGIILPFTSEEGLRKTILAYLKKK